MYRTIVRVTKNVTMKASRQNVSGIRPGGMAKSKFRLAGTQRTYADQAVTRPGYQPTRRCAPIVWAAT